MKHFWALLIKFSAIGTVLLSIYGIFDMKMSFILFMIVATTIISYFVGDLLILHKLGNAAAIIGDLVLTFGLIWFMSYFSLDPTNRFIASLISATSITCIEVLFHLYIKHHVFTKAESYIPTIPHEDLYAAEFSEEFNTINITTEQKEEKKDK